MSITSVYMVLAGTYLFHVTNKVILVTDMIRGPVIILTSQIAHRANSIYCIGRRFGLGGNINDPHKYKYSLAPDVLTCKLSVKPKI